MRGQSVAVALLASLPSALAFAACSDDGDRPGNGGATAGSGPSAGGASGGAGQSGAAGAAGAFGSAGAAGSSLIPAPENACEPAIVLSDGATVIGNSSAWPRNLDTACATEGVMTGSEVVYEFTATVTGVLDVRLSGPANFSISVRTVCADDTSELECSVWPELVRPITEGDTVYIVVQGLDDVTAGPFELSVTSRETRCGDGFHDAPEGCDDGNDAASDGCSASCNVESNELEPNDTPAEANLLASPFFGSIEPGDQDVIHVPVSEGPSAIVMEVRDFGDGACQVDRLNSVVELIDAEGSVLGTSDDYLVSYCSHLVVPGLTPGDYFVRIAAAVNTRTPAFPYVLDIAVNVCGNSVTEEGESCDPPAFGCDELCQLE